MNVIASPPLPQSKELVLGIGDDAACLDIPPDSHLLISTDTLVSGVHFLPQWNPYDIACKSVMVNISDMAAMAADPRWATMALTLPEVDSAWLESFSQGLQDSLKRFNVELIGGDTTKGPLSITLTIMGLVPKGSAVCRSGAQVGDTVYVSGMLGAAALAVTQLQQTDINTEDNAALMSKLLHPHPRVDLNPILRRFASAAIDISDGLSADLNHICVASGVGACLNAEDIPIAPLVKHYLQDKALDLALTGGDDYELCFTVPAELDQAFIASTKSLPCYAVGKIELSRF